MPNKLLIATTVAMLGLSINEARAETYLNSPINTASGACGLEAVMAQVGLENTGYWTGDRHYVRVSAQTGCASSLAIMYLALPPGAVPSPTAQDPVRCLRGRGSTQQAWSGECNLNPGFNTMFGRWYLGWTELGMDNGQGGEWVEIRVPVTYNRRLDINNSDARVSALVRNNFVDLTPILGLSVTYRPVVTDYTATNRGQGFGTQWGSWDGERFDIGFTLYNFFESGTMTIEYGTSNFDFATAPIAIPAGGLSQPGTAALSGLQQNTTYAWRVKFQSGATIAYSTVQLFTTSAYLQLPRPRKCSPFPCL
jgi:hypothetical protein